MVIGGCLNAANRDILTLDRFHTNLHQMPTLWTTNQQSTVIRVNKEQDKECFLMSPTKIRNNLYVSKSQSQNIHFKCLWVLFLKDTLQMLNQFHLTLIVHLTFKL